MERPDFGHIVANSACGQEVVGEVSDEELYRVPVILVNDESAIRGGEELMNLARSLRNSGEKVKETCSRQCLRVCNILLTTIPE